MAAGAEEAEWNRTSHLLAWIQNWSGKVAEKNVSPGRLNPYAKFEPVRESTIDPKDIALMLCGQKAIDFFAKHSNS